MTYTIDSFDNRTHILSLKYRNTASKLANSYNLARAYKSKLHEHNINDKYSIKHITSDIYIKKRTPTNHAMLCVRLNHPLNRIPKNYNMEN